MSRTAALWTSAILTIAFVLIVGAVLLRPSLSHSATAQSQTESTLVTNSGASQVVEPAPQDANGHDDDHGDHHDSNVEHYDDD